MQPQINQPVTRKGESLIGICQAVGDDFGFNPDFLRVVLAVMLLVNAEAVLVAYGIMGVAVLASRLVTRWPRARSAKASVAA
jgi:phage shock protein PspC (stress-responsive transcriptional regulator)